MTVADEYKKLCNEVLKKHFTEMVEELKELTTQNGLDKQGYVIDGFMDIFHAVEDFQKDYMEEIMK